VFVRVSFPFFFLLILIICNSPACLRKKKSFVAADCGQAASQAEGAVMLGAARNKFVENKVGVL
jgi:hypothetical protein